MKRFDLVKINEGIKLLDELKKEVTETMKKSPSKYSDIAEVSRQLTYSFTSGKSKLSTKIALKIYKALTEYFDNGNK